MTSRHCAAVTGSIITARNVRVAPHLQHLFDYLEENKYIQPIRDYRAEYLPIFSRDTLSKIKSGDSEWEEMVPPQVAAIIKERRLLGYKGAAEATKRLPPMPIP